MIRASIIADSINSFGCRLTTFVLTYPRFVHSEVMTHRLFSRNSASSRAIPAAKFREELRQRPAMFEQWTKNKAGMQGEPLTDESVKKKVVYEWLIARDVSIKAHEIMEKLGIHKQNANRLLEPWMHMTCIVSATNYANFFAQRCSPAAMPEMQVLGYRMLDRYVKSVPAWCNHGDWHLPFREFAPAGSDLEVTRRVCVARAARVSYVAFDKEPDVDGDLALFDRLLKSGHWSPFEHVACAFDDATWRGNFQGWQQLRKTMEGEYVQAINTDELMETKPDWIML